MIQINLLPDIKLKFIKTKRLKKIIYSVSVPVCIVVIVLVVGLYYEANYSQKHQLQSLSEQINNANDSLSKTNGLGKILTIQNQLYALDALHNNEPISSRLFSFIQYVVPTGITINSFSLDYPTTTISVQGNGTSAENINQFVDTLKFTNYSQDGSKTSKQAFKNVVLSNFSISDKTSYSITFQFDSLLFSGKFKTISLIVPNIITTRSQIENPDALFVAQPKSATSSGASATGTTGGTQ